MTDGREVFLTLKRPKNLKSHWKISPRPGLPSTHLLLVISGVSLQEQAVFHMQRWLTFWISSSPNALMYFKAEFYQIVT